MTKRGSEVPHANDVGEPIPASGCPGGQRVEAGGVEGVVNARVHPRDRFVSIVLDTGEVRHGIARESVRLVSTSRADIVAYSRQRLAERHAADPAGVERFNGRMSALAAARKRQSRRVDERVLGRPRPGPDLVRPAGMSRLDWKAERNRRIAAHKALPPTLPEKWAGKQGTPETLEKASVHDGALAQLEQNGTITSEQKASGEAIANVYRSIQADVAVAIASLEARVDNDRQGSNRVAESVNRVRLHHAYTLWRDQLPAPKQMILDMIVGDAIGYTVAARRYACHNRRARRLLIEALDAWPECVARAYRAIGREDVEAFEARL